VTRVAARARAVCDDLTRTGPPKIFDPRKGIEDPVEAHATRILESRWFQGGGSSGDSAYTRVASSFLIAREEDSQDYSIE